MHFVVRVGLLTLALAACQTDRTPSTNAAPAADDGHRAGRVSFMVFGEPAEVQAYQGLVRAFEAGHPTVTVQLIHIPGQSDYRKRLAADFAAGTPADVVLLNYRRYAAFAAAGVLEPLGPYLAQSALIHEADFYPQALQPFRWGGQLLCLPQNVSSLVVYYNKDLFTAAGLPFPAEDWDRDDFLAAALTLTRDTNGDGRAEQHGLGLEPSLVRAAPFIWQQNGHIAQQQPLRWELTVNTPPVAAAVQWLVDLQVKYHVVPDAVEEAAESSESRFLNGRLALFLNSRRGVPTYREAAAFDWDVAPLPNYRGRQVNILHADAYCLAAAALDKAAAWAFIEFANSPAGQELMAATGRTVPSLTAVAESPQFLDPQARPAHSRVFLDTLPYLRALPVMAQWADVEELISEEIERAFYGNASVPEALLAAQLYAEEYFMPVVWKP